MKKQTVLVLFILICGLMTSACMKGDEVNQEIVELSDIKVNDGKSNEVVMKDSDTEKRLPSVSTFGEKPEDSTYVDKDGSNIRVSFDAAGNKSQTRYFFNHPYLKMLTVTISGDGIIREGMVFGHNNERKALPEDWLDKALTAPGNDIAYKVGITTTRIVGTQTKAQPNQVYTGMPEPRLPPVSPQPQSQPQQTEPELTQEESQPTTSTPTENQTVEPKPNIAQEKKKKDEGN